MRLNGRHLAIVVVAPKVEENYASLASTRAYALDNERERIEKS